MFSIQFGRFLFTEYDFILKPQPCSGGRVESIYMFDCCVGICFRVRRRRKGSAGGGNFESIMRLLYAWVTCFSRVFMFLGSRTTDLHLLVQNRGGYRHLRRPEPATQLSEMLKFGHCTFHFYKTVHPPSFKSLHFKP